MSDHNSAIVLPIAGTDAIQLSAAHTLHAAFHAKINAQAQDIVTQAGLAGGVATAARARVSRFLIDCARARDMPLTASMIAGGLARDPAGFIDMVEKSIGPRPVFNAAWMEKITASAHLRTEPPGVAAAFDNQLRIYLRMRAAGSEVRDDIAARLKTEGYAITDYKGGYATDRHGKQNFRIGKLLKKFEPAMLDAFMGDTTRTLDRLVVMISRDPDDIARMSINRGWFSCMTFEGGKFAQVLADIEKGTLIAYLVRESDPLAIDPLARILLKPYAQKQDAVGTLKFFGARISQMFTNLARPPQARIHAPAQPVEMIYHPHTEYGLHSADFRQAVAQFAEEKLNAGHAGAYKILRGLHRDLKVPATVKRAPLSAAP